MAPVPGCDIAAYRVASVAVHPTLALLEVDWVGGGVPVENRVAPPGEVDAPLAAGGEGGKEGPERGVEGVGPPRGRAIPRGGPPPAEPGGEPRGEPKVL